MVTALNKVDLLDGRTAEAGSVPLHETLAATRTDFVPVSAVTGWNMVELLERIEAVLTTQSITR
ncbi:MAG TPA: hypothetical protein DCM67_07115 [Propionibacteriaceae bacterium]|nr:hypothetical protein [Propionibacteriaceae bacterium]